MDGPTIGREICRRRAELAERIVSAQGARREDFVARYGERDRARWVEDVGCTLLYLGHAIACDSPALFHAYLGWLKSLFAGHKIPLEELDESLELTEVLLPEEFPGIEVWLARGRQHLAEACTESASFIQDSQPLARLARDYLSALRNFDQGAAGELILQAVAQGTPIPDIYIHVFQSTQREVGRLWESNRLTVAEEHYCTAATRQVMALLYPRLMCSPRLGKRLVAACPGRELHELGLHMVCDLFELAGWDTHYLGTNVPVASLVRTVQERSPQLVALSTTMTFHLGEMRETIAAMRAAHPRVPVLVGGHAFHADPELWRHIGADGYACDADSAVKMGEVLLV